MSIGTNNFVFVIGHKVDKESNIISKAIAWWTSNLKEKLSGDWINGYSHTEILFYDNMMMFSASQYKKSVRFKKHNITSKKWTRIKINLSQKEIKTLKKECAKELGKRYDFLGVAGFVLPFIRENSEKWFCSELTASKLRKYGYLTQKEPCKYSPNDVMKELKNG